MSGSRKIKKINYQAGAAMLVSVIFFLFISLAIIFGLVSPTVREFKIANDLIKSKQSFFLSESGAEDIFFRLKNAKPTNSPSFIELNGSTATTTIADSGYNEKTITALGDVFSRQRVNELLLGTGTGIAFGYGVQVGTGGFTMGNGSSVQGSVYSNGTIVGAGSITGTAVSANSAALSADQVNGSGTPAYDITFGNADSTQDFAQSFTVSTTGVVSKVELYFKKVSIPSNLTVRIVSDDGGSPGTTTLASSVVSASLISTNYGWVNVPFSSNPELISGTNYWIVIDAATNSSRYYAIGANDNGYGSGVGKIGKYGNNWNTTSPAGLDGYFKLYLGGLTGLIDGIIVGTEGEGNAYAHTVNNSNIAGTNYCQEGNNNNKSCDTSLPDPTQVAMPISEQNILDWKNEAAEGGTHFGDITIDGISTSLGPKRITGNLIVTNNAHLTMTGNIWVEGDMDISNNAVVSLSPSYGTSDGTMIVDGIIDISNNAIFNGSGSEGSYIMALSTSTSTLAITLANNGGAVTLYAANGTVNLANNSTAKALNGKYINLNNNAVVIYDEGLANSNFVNGPSGGWNIRSWKEVK